MNERCFAAHPPGLSIIPPPIPLSAPFVRKAALDALLADGDAADDDADDAADATAAVVPPVGARAPFIEATLRDYQVEGVNWILAQFARGVGGILGDEMVRACARVRERERE